MQKKSNWKKQKKKKQKQSKQKAKPCFSCFFAFILLFFRKKKQKKANKKQKKSKKKATNKQLVLCIFRCIFFAFRICFFLLFSEVRFPGVHFWFAYLLLYFCIFFKRLIYRIKPDPADTIIYHLYIAFWGGICYLPPFRGTRNNR